MLLGLDMPDVVYQTVDGPHMTPAERRWVMHTLRCHGEIMEADVAQALTAAVCVYQHRMEPLQELFRKYPMVAVP